MILDQTEFGTKKKKLYKVGANVFQRKSLKGFRHLHGRDTCKSKTNMVNKHDTFNIKGSLD